jgi:tetratricopeptide (TPR) repeat protein
VKARLLAFIILAVFGAVRMPIEAGLERRQRELHFHGSRLTLDIRQRLGQMGFVAALSGFRALVADLLWIESHSAWQRTEWGRMKVLFDTVTSLQPRNLTFWDMSAWHMAYNASAAAAMDEKEPREALRLKAEREYWKIGEDFYKRGIQNNPDHAYLFEGLGRVYREKFKDYEKAFEMFEEASKKPDAMPYTHRFAAYSLAEVPGREREAYVRLKALYDKGEDERLPTLLKLLGELEEKLNVPAKDRIYNAPSQSPPK